MKFLIIIFSFIIFLFIFQCNNKKPLVNSSETKNKSTEVSRHERHKLIDTFEKQRIKNEKKYDSLNIKGDSAKNKSNLIDFLDNTPIYNKSNY